MLRQILFFLLLTSYIKGFAQSVYNSGNWVLHQGAQMGVFESLTNEGNLTANENTLVGFYGVSPNIVNGLGDIDLFDVEFANQIVSFLQTPINVNNNANFISGNVLTPINLNSVFLNFGPNGFYTGISDMGKVTGFAAVTGQNDFLLPVGDDTQLRPIDINLSGEDVFAKGAYLPENPSSPNSLNISFNTNATGNGVGLVSNNEFWLLDSENLSIITVDWNISSALGLIAQDISQIILVGWEIESGRWQPLSGPTGSGDLDSGNIKSIEFIPNKYAALTFGTLPIPSDTFAVNNPTLGDYFLSPNSDGVNDSLVFDNLEDTGANMVRIYNKFGQKVFEQQNYTNEFTGFANTGNFIIKQDLGLPEGVYYYTIDLIDLELAYQGFLFLNR